MVRAAASETSLSCAQTNVQLYNQLCARGWGEDDLVRVRRGHDLALELFSGRYRPSGKPFVAHLVGVASLLEQFGARPPAVVAGLVHSVYEQGDFGTGAHGALPEHRDRLRGAIGIESEDLVERYSRLRDLGGVTGARDRVARGELRDAADREALLIELVDTLEEYLDLGMLYCRKTTFHDVNDPGLANGIELARLLDQPGLARELRGAFERTRTATRPAVLVTEHKYSFTVVPPSQRRPVAARSLRQRLAPVRRRLASLRSAARRLTARSS